MSFWEEWREQLAKDDPSVRPEYSNRLGIWHRDFSREKPGQDEHGNTRYPSVDFIMPPTGAWGGYNKADLLRRGWTRTAIRNILGEPDRRLPRKEFRRDRPECIYETARVLAAEEAGLIRYRKAGKHLHRLPFDTNTVIKPWAQIDECRGAYRKPRKKR